MQDAHTHFGLSCRSNPAAQSSLDWVGVGGWCNDLLDSTKIPFWANRFFIFFHTWTQRTKRKVELTTQVRHLWTSQLYRVWHTQNPSRRARKRSAFVGQTPSVLWTIPTCGIAEELLSKLRSWEVYLEWGPWFPHPKWSHVVGCSENEVYYAFCVHVWCPQDVGRCLIPSGAWCYNPSINFGRPK